MAWSEASAVPPPASSGYAPGSGTPPGTPRIELQSGFHSTVMCAMPLEEKLREAEFFFGGMVERLRQALGFGEAESDVRGPKAEGRGRPWSPLRDEPARAPKGEAVKARGAYHVSMHLTPVKANKAIDGEVSALSEQFPDIFERNSIMPIGGPAYLINHREVRLEVVPGPNLDPQIFVADGPMRQPFLDYMLNTGMNEEWETEGAVSSDPRPPSSVEGSHRGPCDRYEAMVFATHEAERRAANKAAFTRPDAAGWAALMARPPADEVDEYSICVPGPEAGFSPMRLGRSPFPPADAGDECSMFIPGAEAPLPPLRSG